MSRNSDSYSMSSNVLAQFNFEANEFADDYQQNTFFNSKSEDAPSWLPNTGDAMWSNYIPD